GLGGSGVPGAHVMKLNYTSLQHAVLPVEGDALTLPVASPVGVFFLHGQLAPAAWALQQAAPHARLGYVQTAGGALPGGLSHTAVTVLQLALEPVVVALPEGFEEYPAGDERHDWRCAGANLDGYADSGLPATTMGRALHEDALFFAAALAGGGVLAGMI